MHMPVNAHAAAGWVQRLCAQWAAGDVSTGGVAVLHKQDIAEAASAHYCPAAPQDKEAAEAQNAELQAQLRLLQEEREAERPQVRRWGGCPGCPTLQLPVGRLPWLPYIAVAGGEAVLASHMPAVGNNPAACVGGT